MVELCWSNSIFNTRLASRYRVFVKSNGNSNPPDDKYYQLIEDVCRDLYIQSLKQIPPDVVNALRAALERETKPVAISST